VLESAAEINNGERCSRGWCSNSLCEEKKAMKRKWMKTEFDSAERKESPVGMGEMEAKEKNI
jgi:hypothetical protein